MSSTEQNSDDVFIYNSESPYFTGNDTNNFNNTEETLSETLAHPDVLLPYSVLLTIAIYLTIVGILSTFGNILFIITVVRWRYLRNNSHMLLLLNMAVCDLAISLTGYPYTTISGYIGRWVFGSVMCQLYAFLCFTFSQVSMNTLVAVSIFRYIAICHPHMKHLLTSRKSALALGIVWCHALFWTIAPLCGWSSYTFEPTGISYSFNWNDRSFGGVTYVIGTTLFCYISHIVTLAWCYRRIFQVVYRLQSKRSTMKNIQFRRTVGYATASTSVQGLSVSSVDNRPQLEQNINDDYDPPDSPPGLPRCQSLIFFSFATRNLTEMELHVLGMNIAMVVAFITFWTPYAIISCISAFYDKLSPFWYIFPTIFAKTSCMINPLLYGLTNSFLRKQLLLVLRGYLGLTTAIEDFEVMKQRQQDGLYNKEGIFVGKKTGAITHCPCDGCVASRRQIKLLIEQQQNVRITASSNINSPSPAVALKPKELQTSSSCTQSSTHEDQQPASELGELENSVINCSCGGVLYDEDFIGEDDVDRKETGSPQRNPIPLSIFSKELQRNDNTVKARGHSSTDSIILNVNALSKDTFGMEGKATLPVSEYEEKANL